MANTATITVRIDPELLRALKARAVREGRSLSAEVVQLLRAQVAISPKGRRRKKKTMGMFADRDFEDLDLADFKKARRSFSGRVADGIARRASKL